MTKNTSVAISFALAILIILFVGLLLNKDAREIAFVLSVVTLITAFLFFYRFPQTKSCSKCGNRNTHTKTVRTIECPACGHSETVS